MNIRKVEKLSNFIEDKIMLPENQRRSSKTQLELI